MVRLGIDSYITTEHKGSSTPNKKVLAFISMVKNDFISKMMNLAKLKKLQISSFLKHPLLIQQLKIKSLILVFLEVIIFFSNCSLKLFLVQILILYS